MRPRTPFQRIGIAEAEALLERGDVLVLDARDAGSFAKSRVDGAEQISSANLSAVVGSTARNRPILIYCYHGNASREYAQIFADFAFSEVYSLDGGFEAWRTRPPVSVTLPLDGKLQEWLIGQGFPAEDVNAVIANNTTPLMKASHGGERDVVRLLIAAGAAVNARNADGNNALWLACVGSHLDIIDALVDSGIDIDNRNVNGATSLMYAASSGKAAVVERLLARGADVAPETPDGFSALDLSSTAECLALLRPNRRPASAAASDTAVKDASGL
jgi:thiosulfate/3-mercaptopyruvate sulfurtransferase